MYWESKKLVQGAVLTYHFGVPNDPELLYLCLNIPAVQIPHERNIELSDVTISGVPSEIMDRIIKVCSQNKVKLGVIIDYEYDITTAREHATVSGVNYYRNAPTEEILRFASVGTRTAINLLDEIENGKTTFINSMELADIILSRLKKELGTNYFWLREAFHFTSNPMLLNDMYLWTLANS